MTYEQLVVLHAIVTEGTFRAAAEHLHKSQSAISHMLKKLEDEIGIVLLSREAYRPKLTTEGEAFYRQSTRVLHQMQELKGVAKSLSATQEAEVLFTVTATCALAPLLSIIAQVTACYPTTHIRLSREALGGPIERLLEGNADIIIATIDNVPIHQVEAIPFTTVKIVPVAHPDFVPAQSTHMLTTHDMQSYIQIVVADSSRGELNQSRDLLPGGLRWTVSDFAAKKEILLANMGWGGIPEHLIKDELERGELVVLNLESYPPRHLQLYQIRRRHDQFGIVAQMIWQCLLEQARASD